MEMLINIYKRYHLTILNVLIVLLILVASVDPQNRILGLKYPVFCLIFLFWAPKLLYEKLLIPRKMGLILFIICLLMPFYGISIGLLNSFINNSNWGEEVRYFTSFLFFTLTVVVAHSKIDLTYKFNITVLIIVVLSMAIFTALLFLPDISKVLFQYLVRETVTAAIGTRDYGIINVNMVWYRTSPLLVFPLTYFLHILLIKKKRTNRTVNFLILFSIIFTLFLSGTRANLLSLILILVIYTDIYLFHNHKKLFILYNEFVFVVGLYLISSALIILFSKNEPSNIIKYGHLVSYLQLFTTNPSILLWGQGIGLPFYSSGAQEAVFVTELQYFEMVRIWGIPITLVFICVLLLPIIEDLHAKSINHITIAYVAFLFIAGTNPFLLDSTGMLVLVYVFSNMFRKQMGNDFIPLNSVNCSHPK